MGQVVSVCACQGEIDHSIPSDDQLPPLSTLYVPSLGGNHVFIYDKNHEQKVQEPMDTYLYERRRHASFRNESSQEVKAIGSFVLHRPALRYKGSSASIPSTVENTEDDFIHEEVMSTTFPKDTNGKEGSDVSPHLQLRLPIQRSMSSTSMTLPSRPSIHRFVTDTNPSCDGFTNDTRKEAVRKAIELGNIEALETLVPTIPAYQLFCWNWPEFHGDSVLHLSVRSASLPVLMLLLRHDIGGGPVTPNSDGDTPISLAGKLRHFELLAHLMQSLHTPYCRSPPTPLRLSIYSLPPSPSPSVATVSSLSSFHLSTLFDDSCNEVDDEVISSPIPEYSVEAETNSVVQEIVLEIVDKLIQQCALAEEFHQPPTVPVLNEMEEELAPETIRGRSCSLASESDERFGLVISDIEEDDCVLMGSVKTPHSITQPANQDYNGRVVSTSSLESLGALSLPALDVNGDNNDDDDEDMLFCCSPLLHNSTKSLAAATAYMASPLKSLMMLSSQELLNHSLGRGILSCSPREKDDSGADYGLFVDLEQWSSKHCPSDHRGVSAMDEISTEPPGNTAHDDTKHHRGGLHRLVPRRVRKAAGRFVRFLLPNGQQVKT